MDTNTKHSSLTLPFQQPTLPPTDPSPHTEFKLESVSIPCCTQCLSAYEWVSILSVAHVTTTAWCAAVPSVFWILPATELQLPHPPHGGRSSVSHSSRWLHATWQTHHNMSVKAQCHTRHVGCTQPGKHTTTCQSQLSVTLITLAVRNLRNNCNIFVTAHTDCTQPEQYTQPVSQSSVSHISRWLHATSRARARAHTHTHTHTQTLTLSLSHPVSDFSVATSCRSAPPTASIQAWNIMGYHQRVTV